MKAVMTKPFLYVAVVGLAMAAAIAPASAQFPPPPPTSPPAVAPPVVAAPKKKAAPPAGPSIAGNWIGRLNQEGGTAPYTFEISITAKG
jgi:hypothetical protein